LGSDVLVVELRSAQALQPLLHPLSDRTHLLRWLDAVLRGDLCDPSVRSLMVVDHESPVLTHPLLLRFVGRQLSEPDLRAIHLHRVQQEHDILDVQLGGIRRGCARGQRQDGERGECDPMHTNGSR
jgi:hypothetical protein